MQNKWRLASASERELLHGLGYDHTSLCCSFAFVAAMLCKSWVVLNHCHKLWVRMGMAPGFCSPLQVEAPLQRRLCYGNTSRDLPVSAIHGSLLRRVSHTGSDVRITSGTVLNPKAFPRQSCCSSWWGWKRFSLLNGPRMITSTPLNYGQFCKQLIG